jgi:hypothetical protein
LKQYCWCKGQILQGGCRPAGHLGASWTGAPLKIEESFLHPKIRASEYDTEVVYSLVLICGTRIYEVSERRQRINAQRYSPNAPNIRGPRLEYRGPDVVEGDNRLRH